MQPCSDLRGFVSTAEVPTATSKCPETARQAPNGNLGGLRARGYSSSPFTTRPFFKRYGRSPRPYDAHLMGQVS